MDKKQIKQALRQIAAERIPSETDLWPTIQKQLPRSAQPARWPWLPRLGTAMAAIFLFLFFLVWLNSLAHLPQTESTTAVSSQLVSEPPDPNAGLTFPIAPDTLPRYKVVSFAPANTQREIIAWAENFGIANPQLYSDPRSPEQIVVLDENGDRLIFPSVASGNFGVSYLRHDGLELPPGETVSLAEGTAVAIAFLSQHRQLPERYHVRDVLMPMFASDGHPLRTIRISPDLDGYPLLGGAYSAEPGVMVQIDAAGEVSWAGFSQADFVAQDSVAIRSAERVVEDFVNGRLTPLQMNMMPLSPFSPAEYPVQQYSPPLPQYEIGQSVTILETDDTHFLLSLNGSEDQAVLQTDVGAKYELVTSDLARIAEAVGDAQLQVSGTIVGQTAPDTWQLAVTSWEILPQQAFLSGCALGAVVIEADGSAWLTAEAVLGRLEVNGRYHIPNLPTDIHNGDRLEVCSGSMLALPETIPWMAIFVPPRTWHYEGQTADAAVFAQSASPYEVGHTVVVTGLVETALYQANETETVAVTLWADLADGHSSHLYALVGDETLLAELAADQLHHYVQITGTIVLAEDTSWADQALEVSAFAQPWPEQQVVVAIGRFSQERDDGSMLTLFTDEADGQSYGLPEDGPRFEGLLAAEQVWVAGVVHPGYETNGRPILHILQAFAAQPGQTLTTDSYTLSTEPQLVQSSNSLEPLVGGNMIIEYVELAYFFDPIGQSDLAEPVWVVSGHWRDKQELFVAYLDAVVR